jgi:hypothetical protein
MKKSASAQYQYNELLNNQYPIKWTRSDAPFHPETLLIPSVSYYEIKITIAASIEMQIRLENMN